MMTQNSILVIVRILVIVVIVGPSVLSSGRGDKLFRVYVFSDHFREDLGIFGPILQRTRERGEKEKTKFDIRFKSNFPSPSMHFQ